MLGNNAGKAEVEATPAHEQEKGAAGEAAAPWETRQIRWAQAFSGIVAVMMRDPAYRNARLSDLENLVVPAVVSGQWRLGHAPLPSAQRGASGSPSRQPMAPVAAVLWASVSDEIDRALSGDAEKRAVLPPDQWASGENCWVIVAAGDKRGVARIIEQLCASDFAGKMVKVRTRGNDGKLVVQTIASRPQDSSKPG